MDHIFDKSLFNMNTQNKFIILGIIVSSSIVVLIAWIVISSNQSIINESYYNFGRVVAKSLAPEASNIIYDKQEEEAKASLDRLSKAIITNNKDIALIVFRNTDEKIIYPTENIDLKNLKSYEKVIAPMFIDTTNGRVDIGTVYVYLTGETKRLVATTTRNSLFIMFSIVWLISVLAVWLNTFLITRNLSTIVEGVKRVTVGEFGFKVISKDLWGEVKHLVDAFNDMSTRLSIYDSQNIDELTYERNKLEAILLSIANGVIVCDNHNRIIIINESASKLMKAGIHALENMDIKSYTAYDGTKPFVTVVDNFMSPRDDDTNSTEEQIDLNERTVKVIISPIYDFHDVYHGYTLILHDITKEKEIDKLKSDFISNVSHELRTPVTVLRSYIETLAHYGDEFDEETRKEFLLTVDNHVTRLNTMVNTILDFSRLEKEEIELKLEPGDIVPVIELTVKSIEKLAKDKKIVISKSYESNLPEVLLHLETMEKIIRNLISNAIKYTYEGGRIKIKAELDESGDNLEVSVIDSGMGIPEEHIPHLFDRFYRVENKVHTEVGTGIGLEIVKKGVERHGGEIFVKSKEGKGSTFSFKLPIIKYDSESDVLLDDDDNTDLSSRLFTNNP